jgi:hypothetical protein
MLAPLTPPYWLGEQPVVELELRTLRHLTPDLADAGAPRFGKEPVARHIRHGFRVYSGGRELPPD